MPQFNLSADIQEVNRYDFTIIATSEEEARSKLVEYLNKNCPSPFHGDINTGVTCIDREAGMKTLEIDSIQ